MQERFRPSSIFVSLRLIDLSLRIFVSTPRVRCRSPGRGGIDLHASSTNDRPFSLPVAFHPVVTRSLIGSVILYEGIRVHSNSRALTVHDHEKVNEEAASLEHHFDIEARARHLSLSKFLDLLRESFGRSQRASVFLLLEGETLVFRSISRVVSRLDSRSTYRMEAREETERGIVN